MASTIGGSVQAKPMPISGRFVIRYSSLLLTIGLVCLLGIIGMTIWLSERSRIYAEDAAVARAMRVSAVDLRSAMQAAESAQRGFLVDGNPIYLAPYDNAKRSFAAEIERLVKAMAPVSERQEMMRRLAKIVTDKAEEMDDTIKLKSEGRDAEAEAAFQTNRGKALMDEANVFLSSIIRAVDERLSSGVAEQQSNAQKLRWMSLIGGAIIVVVVAIVSFLGFKYSAETAAARDQIQNLNVGLERRVGERTAALQQARDRAEMLLKEVNHRVANSLMMVASLVRLQAGSLSNAEAKTALAVTEARINAIADVHKRLYTSDDARIVALDEYLSELLTNLQKTMQDDGHGASLRYSLEPLRMTPDSSINLGVIVTEWVTNAFKYAYPQRSGEVRVRLHRLPDGSCELAVEDDGVGRSIGHPVKGTGLGSRLVSAMAEGMKGRISYSDRGPGTLASLTFTTSAI